ncbi:MAG: TerC family protein [Smithellaceae bacterium]|nr:TerC family protein [Smithellaceae bacterium]
MENIWWWAFFLLFVLAMLALDLGVFNRKVHVIKVKEALGWTAFWVGLAMLFCLGVYLFLGQEKALSFLAGYLIEESLSVDNLFVFLLIFNYFGVPARYEHKALFWGIIGALIMRAIFIATGVALIEKFHWIIYVFGAFLIFTAGKLALSGESEVHPDKNVALKLLKRLMPVSHDFEGGRFFVVKNAVRYATPLFAVVLVLETTDVIFAVDSIPAVLAITSDPFIVYTSNVFAILGLRSIFFALSGMMRLFHYLRYGLVAVLGFVGLKMLVSDFYKIPVGLSLAVIALFLAASVAASLLFPHKVEIDIEPREIPAGRKGKGKP